VLAGWHDVDVAVEDQRGRSRTGDADAPPRLLTVDLLARVLGVGAELVQVEPPQVDVEPEPLQRRRAPPLHRDLGLTAADAGVADELGEVPTDQVDVDQVVHAASMSSGTWHGADRIDASCSTICWPSRPSP
jgi:hypothetical protein